MRWQAILFSLEKNKNKKQFHLTKILILSEPKMVWQVPVDTNWITRGGLLWPPFYSLTSFSFRNWKKIKSQTRWTLTFPGSTHSLWLLHLRPLLLIIKCLLWFSGTSWRVAGQRPGCVCAGGYQHKVPQVSFGAPKACAGEDEDEEQTSSWAGGESDWQAL